MITRIKVNGRYYDYDLIRVHNLDEVIYGEWYVLACPDGEGMCVVSVVSVSEKEAKFQEVSKNLVPWVWYIREKDLYRKVYRIIK